MRVIADECEFDQWMRQAFPATWAGLPRPDTWSQLAARLCPTGVEPVRRAADSDGPTGAPADLTPPPPLLKGAGELPARLKGQ